MTSRERVNAILEHKPVDRLPRQLWALPAVHMFRKQERERLNELFEWDITEPDASMGVSRYCAGRPHMIGRYTDIYGNVWEVGQNGVEGEVKIPRIADYSYLKSYELPYEILDSADFSRINAGCAVTNKFVLAGTLARPFEAMQFLRGTENLFVDIALNEPGFYELLSLLHKFFMREMRMWVETDVDGVQFMDDWGSQISLLISPEKWRAIFKPLYKEYCDILHASGKKVFFHSDGNITEIYPDLIEIGIDAVNSQLFCMNIEEIGQKYAGKIAFWGEIDRQHILPFGSEQDVRSAVNRVASALLKKGAPTGVIAQCEMGAIEPVGNIIALYDQWEKTYNEYNIKN